MLNGTAIVKFSFNGTKDDVKDEFEGMIAHSDNFTSIEVLEVDGVDTEDEDNDEFLEDDEDDDEEPVAE